MSVPNERHAVTLAREAVDSARRAGADAAEATVSIARRFHTEARDAALAKLERSTGRSLRVRVFSGSRKATLTSSDLSSQGIREAVAQAVAQAQFVAPDEYAGLPEGLKPPSDGLDLYDESVAHRDDDSKVEEALGLERAIRDADSRITNSSGSHVSDAVTVTALANSDGFAGAYMATRSTRSTGPIALDGEVRRTAHYGSAGRHARELETVDQIARKAVQRATELFGARKPPTMRCPVIFDRDVAASILDDVFGALSAANVAIGNSWLVGRLGTRIGSELVTIVDDGRLAGKLGSSPFDAEGVATQRTVVFERGILSTFLYDTYYARKLGATSTGNSNGSGIGTNNLYLVPGTQSLEDVIAATKRGVLVLDTIGFATEHATGTYSRGARGFLIENGERTTPIDEFTIAGSYADMLGAIDAVADDLRFDGSVVSPSFRIAEMTVSGN